MDYNPAEDLDNENYNMEAGEEDEKDMGPESMKNTRGGDLNDDGNNQDELEQTEDADRRSVYVKNVDYSTSREELTEHFKDCGKIVRVTILNDKYTGHPKGFAYIEFDSLEGVENAKNLTDSLLKSRQIQVFPKRTNKPFRGGRRGIRRGRGGGGFRGMGPPAFRGYHMFTGRGFRRGGYKPY